MMTNLTADRVTNGYAVSDGGTNGSVTIGYGTQYRNGIDLKYQIGSREMQSQNGTGSAVLKCYIR